MKDRVKLLRAYDAEMARKFQELKYRTDTITREIGESLKRVSATWHTYEAGMGKAIQLASRKGTNNTEKDPFLLGATYCREYYSHKDMQEKIDKEMQKRFTGLKGEDRTRINRVKDICGEFYNIEKQLLEARLEMVNKALESIKDMDADGDCKAFTDEVNMKAFASALTTPRTSLAALINQEVIKSGILERKGGYISVSWTPVYCIVTKAGFFHYYKDHDTYKLAKVPDYTVQLNDGMTTVRIPRPGTSNDSVTLEIVLSPAKKFSFSGSPTVYPYKARSESDRDEWIEAIKKHVQLISKSGKPMPDYSERDKPPTQGSTS